MGAYLLCPVAQHFLTCARQRGFDVFIIPMPYESDSGPFEGIAFQTATCKYINIYSGARGTRFAHILAHEIAHHDREHLEWHLPTWARECQAERAAVTMLAPYLSEAQLYTVEQQAREYARPLIQQAVNAEIFNHGEADAAVWAGCDISYSDAVAE